MSPLEGIIAANLKFFIIHQNVMREATGPECLDVSALFRQKNRAIVIQDMVNQRVFVREQSPQDAVSAVAIATLIDQAFKGFRRFELTDVMLAELISIINKSNAKAETKIADKPTDKMATGAVVSRKVRDEGDRKGVSKGPQKAAKTIPVAAVAMVMKNSAQDRRREAEREAKARELEKRDITRQREKKEVEKGEIAKQEQRIASQKGRKIR